VRRLEQLNRKHEKLHEEFRGKQQKEETKKKGRVERVSDNQSGSLGKEHVNMNQHEQEG